MGGAHLGAGNPGVIKNPAIRRSQSTGDIEMTSAHQSTTCKTKAVGMIREGKTGYKDRNWEERLKLKAIWGNE